MLAYTEVTCTNGDYAGLKPTYNLSDKCCDSEVQNVMVLPFQSSSTGIVRV